MLSFTEQKSRDSKVSGKALHPPARLFARHSLAEEQQINAVLCFAPEEQQGEDLPAPPKAFSSHERCRPAPEP